MGTQVRLPSEMIDFVDDRRTPVEVVSFVYLSEGSGDSSSNYFEPGRRESDRDRIRKSGADRKRRAPTHNKVQRMAEAMVDGMASVDRRAGRGLVKSERLKRYGVHRSRVGFATSPGRLFTNHQSPFTSPRSRTSGTFRPKLCKHPRRLAFRRTSCIGGCAIGQLVVRCLSFLRHDSRPTDEWCRNKGASIFRGGSAAKSALANHTVQSSMSLI